MGGRGSRSAVGGGGIGGFGAIGGGIGIQPGSTITHHRVGRQATTR